MEVTVILSFDLGANGDYDGMYRWLDDHDALECGTSVAIFKYSAEGELEDVYSEIKGDIANSVDLKTKNRVYGVCISKGSARAGFMIGRRKSAPWEGYGSLGDDEFDDLSDIL